MQTTGGLAMMLRSIAAGLVLVSTGVVALAQTPVAAPAPAVAGAAPTAPRPAAGAAAPRVTRPPLFFREEWKQTDKGGEHPMTAESVGNADLELHLHAPSGEILLTGAAGDENNPIHPWLGMCTSPCAVSLRSKTKLADGTWLVGDQASGSTRDWLVSEIAFADLRWLKLDIARVVTTGTLLDKVDLTKVEEIGFADLMPGSGHGPGGWSDVAQIEVYAKSVAR